MYSPVHQKKIQDPKNWLIYVKDNKNLRMKVCGVSSEKMAWDIFSRYEKTILKKEIQKKDYEIFPIL